MAVQELLKQRGLLRWDKLGAGCCMGSVLAHHSLGWGLLLAGHSSCSLTLCTHRMENGSRVSRKLLEAQAGRY